MSRCWLIVGAGLLCLLGCGRQETDMTSHQHVLWYNSAPNSTFWYAMEQSGVQVVTYHEQLLVTLPTDQLFWLDTATLKPQSNELLSDLAWGLRALPDQHIVITGHSDGIGRLDRQHRLSQQRARQIAGYLWQQGIEPSQLTIRSVANRFPIEPESAATNRRITIYTRPIELS